VDSVMAVVTPVKRSGLPHVATYKTEPQKLANRRRLSEAAATANPTS